MATGTGTALARNLSALRHGDVLFAGLIVSVVALLIVPLPTPLLDVLLTANIGFGVVLLLSSIYLTRPLSFSTFPSVLLVATLFRLALNVSSTRLILSQADAGRVIDAFGQFVVRGNYVVGAVIFLILTVIQFLVIAKGAERVAEVAARFTLDAMPGKQMAIDADLRAGAFNLAEARRRRAEVQRESQLFGAMDGAMKFVKGDAIAGIIITVVNVIGGLIIGIAQRGMTAIDAAETYTLLTIGDGLVSQIPALIVAMAAGLVVTRVGAEDDGLDLGTEILHQLSATPKVFGIAAGLLVALALVPGLPFVPFLALAVASALAARATAAARRRREEAAAEQAIEARQGDSPLISAVTPVLVELGTDLSTTLKARGSDETLREQVRTVREALFHRLGVKLPAVRIRFSAPGLAPDRVRVQVYEVPEIEAAVPLGTLLVLVPHEELEARGIPAAPERHPVTGGPVSRVDAAHADAIRAIGWAPLDLTEQVMLLVGAAAHRRAERFVGLAEVQAALDQLEGSHGALIDAVVPRPVALATLSGVLKRLVGEGVSIRDLRAILEALAEDATEEHDVIELTEIARVGLGRALTVRLAPDGVLRAWLVDHAIEQTVREAIRRDGVRPSLALPPRITAEILGAFRVILPASGAPIIVASQDVRRYLRQLVLLEVPGVVVVGLGELGEGVRLESLGTVAVGKVPT